MSAEPVVVLPPEMELPDDLPMGGGPEHVVAYDKKGRLIEPGFYAYMRLKCRCPACNAEHAKSRGSAKKDAPKRNTTTAVRNKRKSSAREVDTTLPKVLGEATGRLPGTSAAVPAAKWEHVLGEVLMFLLVRLALALVDNSTDAAGLLVPADEEIDALVKPIARVVADTDLNRRYGRRIVENGDTIEALMVAAAVSQRYYSAMRDKLDQRQREAPNVQVRNSAPVNGAGVVPEWGRYVVPDHLRTSD